jgi:hypothetical protein
MLYPKSKIAFSIYAILSFDEYHCILNIKRNTHDCIPIQMITARLIEHHSVFTVDPQSAHCKFEGSTFRNVANTLGLDLVLLVALSFPPVSNSLVSCDPETVLLSFPPFENISPMGCLLMFCGGDLDDKRSSVVAEPSRALSIAFLIA